MWRPELRLYAIKVMHAHLEDTADARERFRREFAAVFPKVEPELSQFLASKGAPANYKITGGLAKLELAGGGFLRWRSNPVSMVCFKSGTNVSVLKR